MSGVGVPIKLLHESQGHICSVETKLGVVFRGKLIEVEDNMSLQLKEVSMTGRDGRVTGLEQVYLRGSQLRYLLVKTAKILDFKSLSCDLTTTQNIYI